MTGRTPPGTEALDAPGTRRGPVSAVRGGHCTTDQMKVAEPETPFGSVAVTVTV